MKKALLALLSILIVFCAPAPARASDDIRIFVNGIQVFSDVPPLIIGERTMVPIRAVSEALGAEVNWNDGTRSVEITNKIETDNNEVLNNETADNDLNSIELLKFYTKIARHYYNLGELHDQLIDISRKIDFVDFCDEAGSFVLLADEIPTKLDSALKNYNYLTNANQQLVDEAEKAGIDIKDTEEILIKYNNAMNFFKTRIYYLENNSPLPLDFIADTADSDKGSDESVAAAQKALEGYNKFNDLIEDILAGSNKE